MHLPTGPTAVYHHHHNPTDWNLSSTQKGGGMLEHPTATSTPGNTSPPGSQDLWWTERLILEAQQEFPGELGKRKFIC